ncbi:MAG: DUF4386 domain-containing protein [Gemmatimonadaceae bacterium]|nr:DUF4386 domain-containing protein [Gemmatimonadaceae bacterium]
MPRDVTAPPSQSALETTNVDRYARAAGILYLLTLLGGIVGEVYIPSRLIVGSDAAATARNILASESLFRIGFAAYLVEAVCDIAISWVWYVLLRPVNRNLALLAAFFGLVSTALYGTAETFFFAALVVLRGEYMTVFSPDQVNALALLMVKIFGRTAGIFMAMYGIATVVRGYLIYRSTFLPRPLGIVFMVAGTGFILRNAAVVLAPGYASDVLLLPMFVALASSATWFLAKGVDAARWNAAHR